MLRHAEKKIIQNMVGPREDVPGEVCALRVAGIAWSLVSAANNGRCAQKAHVLDFASDSSCKEVYKWVDIKSHVWHEALAVAWRWVKLNTQRKQQAADLMAKALNNPQTWSHLLELVQIRAGIGSPAGPEPVLLAAPPGLAQPMSTALCHTCGFNITNGTQCPCEWT